MGLYSCFCYYVRGHHMFLLMRVCTGLSQLKHPLLIWFIRFVIITRVYWRNKNHNYITFYFLRHPVRVSTLSFFSPRFRNRPWMRNGEADLFFLFKAEGKGLYYYTTLSLSLPQVVRKPWNPICGRVFLFLSLSSKNAETCNALPLFLQRQLPSTKKKWQKIIIIFSLHLPIFLYCYCTSRRKNAFVRLGTS